MSGGDSNRIVIVGAGQAGARAALALRSAGHPGAITLIGAERHLPYERPQLSKDLLIKPAANVQFIKSAEDWAALGVDIWLGTPVVSVDPERREVGLADGRVAGYDRLLLTTGMSPRRCAALEGSAIPVSYVRNIGDALTIRERLAPGTRIVLVGGGIIGLEVAAAAVGKGCAVTVIEATDRLLSHALPKLVGTFLIGRHEAEGVAFRFGVTASGVSDGAVLLSDGSRLPADLIVVGIGVEPSAQIAAAFRLAESDSFRVDRTTATPAEDVYAAGDAAIQYSRWHDRWMRVDTWANAQNQAAAAARAMVGLDVCYEEPAWFWSDQHNVNLQAVGDPLGEEQVVRGAVESGKFSVISLRGGEVVGAVTVNDPREMGSLRKLVAARRSFPKADLEDVRFDLRRAAAA